MSDKIHDALTAHISTIIRSFLVSGRQGAPAEGRLPFSPLNFAILRIVGAKPDTRPSEIADELTIPRTTVSSAVKALQKRGLVDLAADKSDGRAVALKLSDEGAEVLEAIIRQDQRNSRAMLAALPEESRAAFVDAMAQIATSIDQKQR